MTSCIRGACVAAALALVPAAGLAAQGYPAPTAEQCQAWASALSSGGKSALDVVTYGNIPACPSVAPGSVADAIRAAHASRDTAYLDALAGTAGKVRDPAVFGAALEVVADTRASNEARVMGLLVTGSSLGSSQSVQGYTQDQLFTRALPADGVCGFAVSAMAPDVDNPLPSDARRQAARAIDGVLYASGEPALVQNLARCARSAVGPEIPPQVDVTAIKVDYVCGNTFRVQNHTGADLTLSVTTTAADGTSQAEDRAVPAKGGWTDLDTPVTGPVQVSYDGQPVATVANAGKRCGGQ
jgi:hypothetical protein